MSKTKSPLAWVNGNPQPTVTEFVGRREKLFAMLPNSSAVILVAAAELLRNGYDNTFTFRQNSDLLYLSGFPEAACAVVLKKSKAGRGRCTMFVSRQDKHSEIWHGKRVGLAGALSEYGADSAFSITTVKGNLRKLLHGVEHVYFAAGVADSKLESQVQKVLDGLGLKAHGTPDSLISELRLVKTDAELEIMHRAGQIAATAHSRAMRSCLPGVTESDLKAEIEYVFTLNGNSPPSYDTIVAAGANGLSLHHPAGLTQVKDGDLVLVDAGCELNGYASDVSRTFPANGRFSTAQRQIYDLILASQLAAIEQVKPGATWEKIDAACYSVLENGLKALGFPMGKGDRKTLTIGDVMPHGLGHWLGIDVHDVGRDHIEATVPGKSKVQKVGRPLVPGMVLTIEPGLYLSLTDKRIPAQYRGIAIRIEDDIAVQSLDSSDGRGHLNLTSSVAKSVDEIEALMAGL